ncbi:MAG: L,D-transpeptidase [Thermomicrobiales bacterium]|nr:L,D-transpeptidase [Thermomicrobiales bacterium]
MRRTIQIIAMIALTFSLLSVSIPLQVNRAGAQQDWAPPRTVYIPATGHTIDGVFLDAWRAAGGVASYGNPVTEELTENGRIVQYYEYARFEYWPEGDADGKIVRLGEIGAELLALQLADLRARGQEAGSQLAQAAEPVDEPPIQALDAKHRYVEATGHTVRYGFKAFWEATGEANYLGNPLTEEYHFGDRVYQFFERGQLRWDAIDDVRMVPVGLRLAERQGLNLTPVAQGSLPVYSEDLFVKPEPVVQLPQPDPNAERWIEINLSWQYLIAWQGDVRVIETYVSTGRSGFETPAGTFFIQSKYESDDMEGTIGGEYYNVPAVPWTMYFTNYGHAIHGAYWHNNFGTPMSHGCVNLPVDVAYWLYLWTPIGARVWIHY